LKIKQKKIHIVFFTILIVSFLGSIFLYSISKDWIKRVLFFPDLKTHKIVGEVRYLPDMGTERANIELLVNDLFLGPSNYGKNANVMPSKTRLEACIIADGIVLLDFSKEIFILDRHMVLQPKEMLQAVANSILFNFPGIKKIFVSIQGQPLSDYSLRNRQEFHKHISDFIIFNKSDLSKQIQLSKVHPLFKNIMNQSTALDLSHGITYSEKILK